MTSDPPAAPLVGFPAAPSGPAMSYRDALLLDLARHAAMRAPFDLDRVERDTAALHEALMAEADRLGAAPGSDPEPALDVLERFALAWVRPVAEVGHVGWTMGQS